MQRRKVLALATGFPALFIRQNTDARPIRSKKGIVVKSTESRFGEKTMLGGKSPNDIKVSAKDTDGDLTIFEYTGHEKGGPPLHLHPDQDEIFFIMEGEYVFQVGDDTHNLKAGDTIFLPREVPHTFAQSTEKGKMIYLFQPSGKMEDFFKTMGNLASVPSPEQGARIFAEHNMKVVGPPLQLEVGHQQIR